MVPDKIKALIEVEGCDVEFEWWTDDSGARFLAVSFHDHNLKTQVQVTVRNPGHFILDNIEVPPSVFVYEEGKRVG